MSRQLTHILHCAACDAAVSEPVRIELEDELPPVERNRPAFSRGEGWLTNKPVPQSSRSTDSRILYANFVLISLESLLENVIDSPTNQLMGCCGRDGSGGPNRICSCGEHVGTEFSDCWMPWFFEPDPAATYWEVVP